MRPNPPSILVRAAPLLFAMALAACASGATTGSPSTAGSAATDPASSEASAGPASAPASTDGTLADACGLLSDAEIEDVTGYPVESRQPAGGFSPIGCQWDLDEGDPELTARVLLNVLPTGGRAQFDSFRASLFEPAPVDGLGDEAVDDGGFLLAIEGDAVVGLGYPGFAFEDGMAPALVEIVLGRL